MRKRIAEPKRKNNNYSCRVDGETHLLVQKALEKLNKSIEISLNTFTRLALKHFSNKVLTSEDIGLVFK